MIFAKNQRLKLFLVIFAINSQSVWANCEQNVEKDSFMWADYLVLGSMLVVSCGVGVFYGFCGKKQETGSDFLLGGSSMGTFPMAMSLAARYNWLI